MGNEAYISLSIFLRMYQDICLSSARSLRSLAHKVIDFELMHSTTALYVNVKVFIMGVMEAVT